jgi:hypothetical protein
VSNGQRFCLNRKRLSRHAIDLIPWRRPCVFTLTRKPIAQAIGYEYLWGEAGREQQTIPFGGRQAQLAGTAQHILAGTRPLHQPFFPPENRLPSDANAARQFRIADPGPVEMFS